MGIYYSSVGTRLTNYLRLEGLTVEDFAVLNPELCIYIHHLGRKSRIALLERLEEKGLKPGTWSGGVDVPSYTALRYYKEHKDEVRRENPIVYIDGTREAPKPDAPKSTDTTDWGEFRRETARMLLMKFLYDKTVPAERIMEYAVQYADGLIAELKREGANND